MATHTDYLDWANRTFGTVGHNLAKAGVMTADITALYGDVDWGRGSVWSELRRGVAAFNGVAPDNTLPALGTSHALSLAYAALLEPGDEVLVERPAYEPLITIAEDYGARVTRFDRRARAGWRLEADVVGRALTDRTRLVVVTSPHNPSGVRDSADDLTAVARVCASRDIPLLVDEIYAPWGHPLDADGVWGASARHLGDNVVAVGGLTKAYGLGPVRSGWMLGAAPVIARGEAAIRRHLCDPPMAQSALALRALAELPALARAAQAQLAGAQAIVERWVAAQPDLRWFPPTDGLFGWVQADATHLTDLTETIVAGAREHDVLVVPGSFFDDPSSFRLGWSLPRRRLEDALARLRRVLPAPLSSSIPTSLP